MELLKAGDGGVDPLLTANAILDAWRAGASPEALLHQLTDELAVYHKARASYDSYYFKSGVRDSLRAEVYELDLGAVLFTLAKGEDFPVPALAERDRIFMAHFGEHAREIIRREEEALQDVLNNLREMGVSPPAFFDRATLQICARPPRDT